MDSELLLEGVAERENVSLDALLADSVSEDDWVVRPEGAACAEARCDVLEEDAALELLEAVSALLLAAG